MFGVLKQTNKHTESMTTTLNTKTQLKSTTGQMDTDCVRWNTVETFEKGTELTVLKSTLDVWVVQTQDGRSWTCHKNRLETK